ncbi:MAG: hypothetical protein A3J27_10765 [Candidatus Tectomicrobia bacterium RIFCSPLOWO2_12_FULL_69_37]|nr:MAG: hypothetical protein A3J27_10765 [Candidatus Tectomicrobia bacterium RIFCSPLOWO2_12_FULL_69_37]
MANQLLLVDDSPLIHRVVELTFEGQDFSIHAADTPEQALAMARTVKPDIVVASAEMKGAGGAEICRRLRQEGELGETPVLLLTSAKSRISEDEARQAGAAGVLVKPFEPERLLAEVGRAMARGGAGPEAAAAAGGPPGQESPSGLDLFDDRELESLFAGGQESPAKLPVQAQDDSDLLLQAEKVLDQGDPSAAAAAPPASAPAQPDSRLFDDSELDDLFAEEAEEKSPAAPAPQPPAAQAPGEEWADLDLEADIVTKAPERHGDLADLAREQASAAEAQLAEIEAEFASSGAPTEEDMQAAESRIENLQEELSRDLAGAGNIQLHKRPAAPPPAPASPAPADIDDDLLDLAAEAGFGRPRRTEPETALDSKAGVELDLEAELAAAGVSGPGDDPPAAAGAKADLAIDDLVEAGYTLPTDEPGDDTPVWDIPLKQRDDAQAAEPAAAPAGSPGRPEEGDLAPLVQQSLERTVEAIVPALIRNIEALVVKQLPDLVEKIVLREIDKIKRGE